MKQGGGGGGEGEGKEGGGEAAATSLSAQSQLSSMFRLEKASTIFFPRAPFSTLLKCLLKKIWDEIKANRAVAKLGMGRAGVGEK